MNSKRSGGWMGMACGLMMLSASGGVLAAQVTAGTSGYTPGDKLVRGLANVCLGFIEIPRNIHNTTQEDSLLAGWTVGMGKGLGYTVMRMGVGIYEVLTFPFPLPKDYVPVITPEYVWQAPGPRMK